MPAEVIIGAVIGAAAASTRVRKAVRRGLIYGVGGVLVAYDKLAGRAHALAQSAREAVAPASEGETASVNGSPTKAPEVSDSHHPVEASAGAEKSP
jgi:hypothetical protein